jgi:hypothetical protein
MVITFRYLHILSFLIAKASLAGKLQQVEIVGAACEERAKLRLIRPPVRASLLAIKVR